MKLVGKKLYRIGPLKCFKGTPPSKPPSPSPSPSPSPPPPAPAPAPPSGSPSSRPLSDFHPPPPPSNAPSARPPSDFHPPPPEPPPLTGNAPSARPPSDFAPDPLTGNAPSARPPSDFDERPDLDPDIDISTPPELSWWQSAINKFKDFIGPDKKPTYPDRADYQDKDKYDEDMADYREDMGDYLSSLTGPEMNKLREDLAALGQGLTLDQREMQDSLNNILKTEEDKKREAARLKLIREKKLKNRLKGLPAWAAQNLAKVLGQSFVIADGVITGGEITNEVMDNIDTWFTENFPSLKPEKPVPPTEDQITAEVDTGIFDDPDNPNMHTNPSDSGGDTDSSQGGGPGPGGVGSAPAPAPPKVDPDVSQGLQDLVGADKDRRERLLDRLEAMATGKDSLAKKQMKAMQEKSLKERLAQMQSMRGAPTAAKMRMFDRAQGEARRELAAAAPMLSLKERKEADYLLSQMLENDKNRDLQKELADMNLADKQKFREMTRAEAIRKGQEKMWLAVAAESWKLFKGDISQWYNKQDFFGLDDDDDISNIPEFDDEAYWNTLMSGGSYGSGYQDPTGHIGYNDPPFNDTLDFDGNPGTPFRRGGFVEGLGNETSDSIPARLSDGEFVIKASAVRGLGRSLGGTNDQDDRKKGVDFLYKLQDRMDKVEKYAEGGEAYVRPKRAFREAIGYESESRFHDKAEKDAKFGGARRKFRHFQDGGPVDFKVKPQFKVEQPSGYGSVIAAQGDLNRRLEELERRMGR